MRKFHRKAKGLAYLTSDKHTRSGRAINNIENISETYMLRRLNKRRSDAIVDSLRDTSKSPEIIVEIPVPGESPRILRALLDSGSSGCIILNEFAKGLERTNSDLKESWLTKGGIFYTKGKCKVPMILPDFTRTVKITFPCHVDPTQTSDETNYDMILGRDFMHKVGIDLLLKTYMIVWDGIEVPMREWGALRDRRSMKKSILDSKKTMKKSTNGEVSPEKSGEQHVMNIEAKTKSDGTSGMQSRITRILDAKYEKVEISEVVAEQTHLKIVQQRQLYDVLLEFKHLFDGTLGEWKGTGVSFKLKDNAVPFHGRAYPIAQKHEAPTKTEVARLCKLGVLEECHDSEWGAPSFIIPKKDNTVRFLSDFRRLNAMLRRTPFPLPKIQDMLQRLVGFMYASALDLNMGYYTIRLNPDAQRLCTIVLPWGKYKYKRLPMGVSGAPDIFQQKMSSLMTGLDFVKVYLDDCLITSNSDFKDHLSKLSLALKRISDAGLRVNIKKSYFGRDAIEYLGHWVTREGIQPLPGKVEAMLQMEEPKNRRELRGFVGLVNYYRDMWKRRSHVLAPLTDLCSETKKWQWGERERAAFNEVKSIISKDAILAFPDFNEEFVIYTDASKLQLGGVITQKGKTLAFYSRKLNDAQTRYTTTERELLSIVETLKEFKTVLFGQRIVVYTDHKNLTCENLTSDRVIRWRLLLEEYGVTIKYIKGAENVVADALSRQPTKNDPLSRVETTDKEGIAECFKVTKLPSEIFPLNFATIKRYQDLDATLQKYINTKVMNYSRKTFRGGENLIVYRDKICVPEALRKHVIHWYHEYLMHPGETRMEETIAMHLYWPNIRKDVHHHVSSCPRCQLAKTKTLKYGHVPEKDPGQEIQPWNRLCVDTIGPYFVRRKGMKTLEFIAVTMIDPATSWLEMKQLKTKRADEVASAVETTWLTRYPWPQEIVFDAGSEFKAEFKKMIEEDYGIKAKPITVRNPQSNGMIERIHAVVKNMIRTFDTTEIDINDKDPFIGLVSSICWAVRSTYHTTLKATPGQLVFGRDMIFNVQYEADWKLIHERKRKRIIENNARENARRIEHDYAIGERVLITKADFNKMETPREGPYPVLRVHANGTLTIQKGCTEQRINIRQCTPYVERNAPE
jgi:transposase InsO family protein